MSQKICNRPLNVTYGDLRTSAEGDNSIQLYSAAFAIICTGGTTLLRRPFKYWNQQVATRHSSRTCCCAGGVRRAQGRSGGAVHRTFSLFGLNEHLLTFRQFWMICDRKLSLFLMRTACRILRLTRRLQQWLWTVCRRRLVSYRAKGHGCVAPSIHIPDTSNNAGVIRLFT